jgi:hypothetical protein
MDTRLVPTVNVENNVRGTLEGGEMIYCSGVYNERKGEEAVEMEAEVKKMMRIEEKGGDTTWELDKAF